MKKAIKCIAVLAALTLTVMVFAACGAAEKAASDVASAVESGASAVASAVESAVADLSKPDVTITEGDYAAMEAFAKELQNGQDEGKVVKITGLNSRSNFGAKASILQSNGEGQKIGSTYVITGVDSIENYPENDATIEITGVVVKSENGISCQIEVAPENVVIK